MYKNNINLNNYKIFYEVALSESITDASKKLYLTQSAISKSIKKLESDLNVELFYRTKKGVKLTEKGKELLYYVEKAFNSLIIAERNVIESENLDKGKLSIGVPSQIGSFYIFEHVLNFHKKYPNIEITIISKRTTELLKLLETHEIDFVIDSSPINTNINDIIIKPLISIKNCFVVSESSSINYNDIKTLKDLSNYPLILPIKGTNNRRELDRLFINENIELSNVINIHTSEMIVSAIKDGLGIGYILFDVVKDNIKKGEFKIINLNEKLPKTKLNLVYKEKYLTIAPKYFIENYLNVHI